MNTKLTALSVLTIIFLPSIIFSQAKVPTDFDPRQIVSIYYGLSTMDKSDLKRIYNPSYAVGLQYEYPLNSFLLIGGDMNMSVFSLDESKMYPGETASSPLRVYGFSSFLKFQSQELTVQNFQPFVKLGAGVHYGFKKYYPPRSYYNNYYYDDYYSEETQTNILFTGSAGVNYLLGNEAMLYLEAAYRMNNNYDGYNKDNHTMNFLLGLGFRI
ncbi:MAG: hypothetical protein J0M18_18385 [Ignavibacteria bacterium]|nr:hypothetical protein [Ignavibacteria bacterium]